ncbi:MAG TPA: DUF3224 domain-containing protein [Holophagaceae bacterium]|nr:DUF3224 domain-containing protein [Holophagaceae bacterium]
MIPSLPALVLAQAPLAARPPKPLASQERPMTTHATGTFDVNVKPLTADNADWGAFGRLSIDKVFHGDLEGTSLGQMLAEGDGKGAGGGYVALERVTGTLHGRKGTFVLMHTGTLVDRRPEMVVTVVPGSGTGDLVGLSGRLQILLEGGKHGYAFDYTLPAGR